MRVGDRAQNKIVSGKILDYTGAGARLAIERALKLDDRWAVMVKRDGVYARVSLDGRGRISRVLAQTGGELRAAADLIGIVAGPPDSVLHGELEAHTEAGRRAAAARGWAALHLFDVTRFDGVDVADRPYEERYGLLHQGQAALECDGGARRRSWKLDARGNAHATIPAAAGDLGYSGQPSLGGSGGVRGAGRFCRAVPRDLRRLPIVPLVRGRAARAELWREHVELGGGEGLVAVRLDAAAGARGGKRKVKQTDTLDATVISTDGRAMRVTWRGIVWAMSGTAAPGTVVEVAHDGWYESGTTPRFARMVRRRTDKLPAGRTAEIG